jgi:hypothetical protein
VGAVAALSLVASAAAAPPAGTPDPRAMALKAGDFTGAVDLGGKAGGATGEIAASYQTKLGFVKAYGASKYSVVVSTAFVAKTAGGATLEYHGLVQGLSTKSGQEEFIKGFLTGAQVKRADVTVGRTKPHKLGAGDASIETGFVFTSKKTKKTSNLSLSAVLLDRVVVFNIAGGAGRRVVAGDAKALARLVVAHATPLLVPIALAPPTVAGTPQLGQTLTATNGTWGNTTSSLAYQWQNCDATGVTCNDIPNATTATYVVQPTDAGLTLRVRVTATNRFGTLPATSAVTAAVS